MRICVVGIGYVGLVTAGCMAEAGNDVVCVDNDAEKIGALKNGVIPIYERGLAEIVQRNVGLGRLKFSTSLKEGLDASSIVFIAVGTPCSTDGSPDMSAICAVAEEIGRNLTDYRIIVTKSTVPVGTHRKVTDIIKSHTDCDFDYVSNPEFLKEGAAVDDFMSPERIIVGTENRKVRAIMKRLYAPFMRKSNRILFMDPTSAEMTKYAANTMLATRISLMNEISRLCEVLGADVELVRRGLGSDSRIGSAFLFPGVGYGGSCFPKDVRALIHTGGEHGVEMHIAAAVQRVNAEQRHRFARRVVDYFAGSENKVSLAVWGLAFKARTDDVRESPAIYCIEEFLDAGMNIKAYDPEAGEAAAKALDGRIEICSNGFDALEEADALVVLTDWQEFRNPDFEAIARKLRRPVIFDGRNLYDPDMVAEAGIEYHCVGRPSRC